MIPWVANERFNPFTAQMSLSGITDEAHFIPSSPPYYIQLREIPTVGAVYIPGFTEVQTFQDAGAGQYVVDYQYGTGLVMFSASSAGSRVLTTYSGRGTVICADLYNHLALGYLPFTHLYARERAAVEIPCQAGMWHGHELVSDFTWDRDPNAQHTRIQEIVGGPWPDTPDHSGHFVSSGCSVAPGSESRLYDFLGGGNATFYSVPNSLPVRVHVRARTRLASTPVATMTRYAGLLALGYTGGQRLAGMNIAAGWCWSNSVAGYGNVAFFLNHAKVATFSTAIANWQSYTFDYTPGLVRTWIDGTLVGTFSTWVASATAWLYPGYGFAGVGYLGDPEVDDQIPSLLSAFYIDRFSCIPTAELLLP